MSDALRNNYKEQSLLNASIDVEPMNESAHSFLPVSMNDQLENEIITFVEPDIF